MAIFVEWIIMDQSKHSYTVNYFMDLDVDYTRKNALKCGHVLDLWKTVVDNRHEWRRLIRTVFESHDIKRTKEDESRRERRGQKKSRP